MINMVFFVLNNILTIYISICLSWLLAGNGPDFRRFLIAVANFALIVYAVVITIGCAGILSSKSIVIILIPVAGCLTPYVRRQREYKKKCLSVKNGSFWGNNNDAILLKFSLILFFGFAAEWIYKSFMSGTYFGPDDLVYHASITAQWIVDRKITLVPFTYQTYYPLNAEIMSLWFMLPFHNDTYTSITSFYWILLSLAAIYTIHRSFKYSMISFLLVGALFIGSTGVQGTSVQKILQSFSANDLAGPAMLVAAFAILLTAEGLTPRGKLINSLYSGLMTGFAVGIKVSFAPVVFVILLWLFFSQDARDLPSFKWRTHSVFLFIAGLMLTGGFWYIRNILITGNPVFPAEFGPFKGPFGLDDQYRTKLISWIIQSPFDLNQWLRIAKNLGDWPLHFGIISMIGYITAIYFLIKNWIYKVNTGVVWHCQTLLLIAGTIIFFSFFFLPFSATTNHPTTGLKPAGRYVIFSYTIGLILFSRLINGNPYGERIWKMVALCSLLILSVFDKKLIIYPIFFLVTIIVFYKPFGSVVTTILKFKHTGFLFLVASFAFLVFWYPFKKQLTDEKFYSFPSTSGKVFKELENFPDSSRIGFFSSLPYNNTPVYRLFGRRLQMIPVLLDYDGSVPGPLHTMAFGGKKSWWDEWDKIGTEINDRKFQFNIHQSSVQYIIVARFPYNKWPVQYNVFEKMDNAIQIYNDGHSAIWKIPKAKPDPNRLVDHR